MSLGEGLSCTIAQTLTACVYNCCTDVNALKLFSVGSCVMSRMVIHDGFRFWCVARIMVLLV